MPASTRAEPSVAQKRAARIARKERLLARKEDFVIPLLARRSYHLPGNGWVQDWIQWFCNNHILFGICLHHPLHPVEWWERLLALVASISFGLVATNAVYEIYQDDREGMEEEVFVVMEYPITKGMLLVWSFGGLCHSIFDFVMWKIMACACCHPGGTFGKCFCNTSFQNCGSYMLLPIIVVLLSLAVLMAIRRLHNQDIPEQTDDAQADDLYAGWQESTGPFFFLAKYSVELFLAWFLYFPVIGTIMFSGILGCGRLPVLGGRPRDVRLVQEDSREYRRF